VPSLALGSAEATPLEVATAFATLAAEGRRPGTHLVDAVTDPRGEVILRGGTPSHRAATPEATYLAVNLMMEAARSGTAARVVSLGFDSDVAGKTGTTNDRRDAWFVGFTPERLALVWVGYDDNHPLGLEGSQAALPIWLEIAARAGFDRGHVFPRPENIVEVEVDPETGERATERCSERQLEIFIAGTEPEEDCPLHSRGGFWRRLFGG
jgi:membrane carboxypeptidase/penicillin-binding protein